MRFFALLLCTLFLSTLFHSTQALAQDKNLDYSQFKQIPILHEGRIKPLDSFARIHLKRLTGSNTWNGQPAIAWLAETLFKPTSETNKLFTIRDPDLKAQLDLPEDGKHFSLHDIEPGLNKTSELAFKLATQEAELTKQQQALLKLHQNATTLHDLHRSLSLLMPLPLKAPNSKNEDKQTYRTLKPAYKKAKSKLLKIINRKGENPNNYTAEEKTLALFTFQMDQLRIDGERTNILRVISSGHSEEWISPWLYDTLDQPNDNSESQLVLWKSMAQAYREGNQDQWQNSTEQAQKTKNILLWLETQYNKLNLYKAAMGLYTLTILFTFAAFLYQTGYSRIRPAYFWPQATLALATLSITAAIILRMIILGRPPVSTLYESTLFVTAIASALGFIIAHKQKSNIITIVTAMLGLGLMLLAPILIKEGESMEMLVAVLNTNFWLATHVVIITMGYGVSILAASLGHITLGLHIFNTDKKLQKTMLDNSYKAALGALLLTAIGTVLGGIWADQSWGRFWGWDPKENGALLIVLWLIWILHGRMAGKLKNLSFSALLAALNIIVAITWFGVNLLGVGLHSYGFTSGLATGLFIFCSLEITIIAALYFLSKKRIKT